ncbi:hypothetical protein [Microbulbifer sp. TYP-18]|uniref:hypothetical protein n=1 Tax=Microbulbifer sp. TYP-18 TaxID=3230024 RepID=UPI0034C6CAFC
MTGPTVQVKYIGNKPAKRDTVCGTGTLWAGHGDVQAFPRDWAALLLRHPKVWQLVDVSAVGITSVEQPLQPEASVHDEKGEASPTERREVGQPTLSSAPATGEVIDPEDTGPEPLISIQPQGEGQVGAPSTAENNPENQAVDLVAVIRTMPKDEAHFNRGTGKPKVARVRALAGDPGITADDVKRAWETINSNG